MEIAIVADCFGEKNNGTSEAATRLVAHMEKRGHKIRVVSPYKSNKPTYYTVPSRRFGIFTDYVEKKNGVIFGQPEKNTIWRAIKCADVVHFLLPFKMSKCAVELCNRHHIPHTTSFHCQPENITTHMGLSKIKPINSLIYKYFHDSFYKKTQIIHCPSKFVDNKLKKHGFKTKNYVISNGVENMFTPSKTKKPTQFQDKFCIIMSGRYSLEKRQDLIIKAVKISKYEKDIQIICAGMGPKQKYYENLGKTLTNKPIFSFFSKQDLVKTINFCDLYIHASDFEIEGIGCIEALSCGIVPILSDSKEAALYQFALNDMNIFKSGNHKDLAKKIDYWVENPHMREKASKEYTEHMKQYEINHCMDQMETMFFDAIKLFGQRKKYNGMRFSPFPF
ncbi:MAG: glycosyltransferase [Spirochaetales bacterium]